MSAPDKHDYDWHSGRDQLLSLAHVYLKSGALDEAETCALSAARADQSSIEPHLILARVLTLRERRGEALKLLESIPVQDDPEVTARVAECRARLLLEEGRYEECLREIRLEPAAEARSISELRLSNTLAACYARTNDLSRARRQIEWTLRESERLGWLEGLTDALTSLALIYRTAGNWAIAEKLLIQAKGVYAGLGIRRKEIQAALNLGLQLLWKGDLTTSERILGEVSTLARQVEDFGTEASARMDRALALTRLRRTAEARRELSLALRLCRRYRYPRRSALAHEFAGELYLSVGLFHKAQRSLRRALAIANRIAPEGDIVPEVRRRQAEVAFGLGAHNESLEIARDAEQRALRLGDRYERATTLRVQALALRALHREEEALEVLQRGLRILEELGETFERDRFLRLIGEILPEEGAATEEPARAVRPEAKSSSQQSRGIPTNREVRRVLDEFGIVGKCRALMDLMRHAIQVAPLDLPVLIQGETGTGKELLAQAIHKIGRPSKAPLIAFNCATCPPDLLDAELFGHSKGAYTGAHASRLGLVRSAEGGTLFLDEIGEMREESQARLLRLLDSGEVRPLGADQSLRVKVRIIAATHADLSARIRERRFRQDLYFRLAGVHLVLPALRDRPGDVRELVDILVREARESVRSGFMGFSDRVLAAMERYSWPGNVRQLKHEILRVAALAPDGIPVDTWVPFDSGELKLTFLDPQKAAAILDDPGRLRELLRDHNGQITEVAKALGISRGHLYRVLRRAGINVKDVRSVPPGSPGSLSR